MENGTSQPSASARVVTLFPEKLLEHITNGMRGDGTPGKGGDPWRIQQLAGKVGTTGMAVSHWISGKRLPNRDKLVLLMQTFFGSNPAHDVARTEFFESYALSLRIRDTVPSYKPLIAPSRCFGRDAELDTLVAALTASPRSTVAVLGPPGVGKSTVTRKAAVRPPVIKRFGERRWFVELEAARDATALQTAIIVAIGLDPVFISFRDALDQLSRQACLLVLDNLETPWEQHMAAVQDCLRQLAARPNVTILASLRGTMAPAEPAFVHQITLSSLAPSEAKRLFLDLARSIPLDDPHLEPLLRELHGMPLAVELVAYRAQGFHSLRDIWDEWQRIGLRLAVHPDQEDGRYTSLQHSIELSWQSSRLRQEGRRLFAMLGQLPKGMARQDRAMLMEEDAHEATRQLLATGLAFERETGRIDLLPPIRAFARTLLVLGSGDAVALINHYLETARNGISKLTLRNGREVFSSMNDDFENIQYVIQVAGQGEMCRVGPVVGPGPGGPIAGSASKIPQVKSTTKALPEFKKALTGLLNAANATRKSMQIEIEEELMEVARYEALAKSTQQSDTIMFRTLKALIEIKLDRCWMFGSIIIPAKLRLLGL